MKSKKIVMMLSTILSSGGVYVTAAPGVERNSSMSQAVYNPLHDAPEQKSDAIKNNTTNKQAALPETLSKAHNQAAEQKQPGMDIHSFQPTKPIGNSVSLQENSFSDSSEIKPSKGAWTDLSHEDFDKPQTTQGFDAFDQEAVSSPVNEKQTGLFSSPESQESLQTGVDSAGIASSQELPVDQAEHVALDAEKDTNDSADKQVELLKSKESQGVSEQKSDDLKKVEEKSNLNSVWNGLKALLSKIRDSVSFKPRTPEQIAASKSAAQKVVAKYPELDKPVATIQSGIDTLSNSEATKPAKTQAVQGVVNSIEVIENSSATSSPEVQQLAASLTPEVTDSAVLQAKSTTEQRSVSRPAESVSQPAVKMSFQDQIKARAQKINPATATSSSVSPENLTTSQPQVDQASQKGENKELSFADKKQKLSVLLQPRKAPVVSSTQVDASKVSSAEKSPSQKPVDTTASASQEESFNSNKDKFAAMFKPRQAPVDNSAGAAKASDALAQDNAGSAPAVKRPAPNFLAELSSKRAKSEEGAQGVGQAGVEKSASVKKPLPFLNQLKSAQPVDANESAQSPDTAPALKKSSSDQPAVKMQMSLLDGIKSGKNGLRKTADNAPSAQQANAPQTKAPSFQADLANAVGKGSSGLKSTAIRPKTATEKPMSELEKKLAARRTGQASGEDNSYNASNTEASMEDELFSETLPSPKVTAKKSGSQSSSPASSRPSSPSSSLPSSPRGVDASQVESGFNTSLLKKAENTKTASSGKEEDPDTTDDEWQ